MNLTNCVLPLCSNPSLIYNVDTLLELNPSCRHVSILFHLAIPHWDLSTNLQEGSAPHQSQNLQDAASTNIYLSNLPLEMTEEVSGSPCNSLRKFRSIADLCLYKQMAQIFSNFRVVSTKVLRDASGASRGVGFVRYVC